MSDIDPSQIDLQAQLNDLLRQRTDILSDQNSAMSGQSDLASSLRGLLGQIGNDAGQAGSGMGNLNDALGGLIDQSGDAEGNMSGLFGQLVNSKTAAVGLGLGMAKLGFDAVIGKAKAAAEAIQGLLNPFSAVTNILGKIGGAATAGFGFLLDSAREANGAGTDIANAWEDVKKSVSTVGPNFEAVKGAVAEMGMEGASVAQMFGPGPDGMAGAIRYAGELAGGLAETFTLVADDFKKNVDSYVIANKALGISAEGMKNMYLTAAHSGRELSDVLDEQARAVVGLSEQFGVDAKHIGKNLDAMSNDFATFGGLSTKELAATAAYAAKLGVGMKALQGIVGKTDDFEGAATAASELASTFGMNIDAMDLMTADPAEKLQMMRDAFQETGKSFADMSRQEKQRMADLTGMDVSDLAGALNPENAEVDFSSMEDAAGAAVDGAVSQEEANLKLAKSIDKLHKAMAGLGSKGPFGAFLDGLTKGLMNSPQMLAILRDLSASMQVIYNAGKEVGRMFATELGPGGSLQFVGDFLHRVFDPTTMKKRMQGVIQSFKDFFAALRDPKKSVNALGDLISNLFDNIFGGAEGVTSGGIQIKDFFIKVFDMAFGLLIGAIPGILVNGVNFIINLLDGFTAAMSGEEQAGADAVKDSMFPMISNAFAGLMDGLSKINWRGLVSSFVKFITTAFKEHPDVMIGIVTFMFGGPALSAAFAAIKMGAVAAIGKGFRAIIRGGVNTVKDSPGVLRGIGAIGQKFAPNLSAGIAKGAAGFARFAGPVAIVASIGLLGASISKLQEVHGKRMEEEFGKTSAKAGILAAGIVDTITFGLLPDSVIVAVGDFFANINKKIADGLRSLGLGNFVDAIGDSFDLLFDMISGFGDILRGIFSGDKDLVTKGFKKMFSGALEFIKNLPGNILAISVDIIKAVSTIAMEVAIWLLTDGLKMLIGAVSNLVSAVGGALYDGFMAVVDFILDPMPVLEKALAWGAGMMQGIWEAISGLPEFFWNLMTDAWTRIAEFWGFASPATKMIELGTGLLNGLINGIAALGEMLLGVGRTAWEMFSGFFTGLPEALGRGILNGIKSAFDLGGMMMDAARAAWRRVTSFFSGSPLDAPTSAGGELGQGISGGVAAGLANLGPEMVSAALEGLRKLAEVMSKGAVDIGMQFINAFGELAQGIVQQLTNIGTIAQQFFSNFVQIAVNNMQMVIQVFSNGFNMMIGVLQQGSAVILGIIKGIGEVYFSFFSGMVEVATRSITAVVTTIASGFSTVFQVFTQARDFILGTFEAVGSTLVRIFSGAITSVVDVVAGGVRGMVNILGNALRLVGNVIQVTTGLGSLGGLVSAIGNGLSFFGPDPEDAQQQLRSFEVTFNAMTRTQNALRRLEKSLAGGKGQAEQTAERIAQVVDAYNESTAVLSGIRPINIDAVLERVNESLKVRRRELTIKQENINIHINMRVTMEAGQVLKAIQSTSSGKALVIDTDGDGM